MAVTMMTYTETWNITFQALKALWKILKYKINIFYTLKKTNLMTERKPHYWIISFSSKDILTFSELVVENTLVKNKILFVFMEVLHLRRRKTWLLEDRTFHCKVPFPLSFISLRKPTVGKFSYKNVQCFLHLVTSILNSEKDIN